MRGNFCFPVERAPFIPLPACLPACLLPPAYRGTELWQVHPFNGRPWNPAKDHLRAPSPVSLPLDPETSPAECYSTRSLHREW